MDIIFILLLLIRSLLVIFSLVGIIIYFKAAKISKAMLAYAIAFVMLGLFTDSIFGIFNQILKTYDVYVLSLNEVIIIPKLVLLYALILFLKDSLTIGMKR